MADVELRTPKAECRGDSGAKCLPLLIHFPQIKNAVCGSLKPEKPEAEHEGLPRGNPGSGGLEVADDVLEDLAVRPHLLRLGDNDAQLGLSVSQHAVSAQGLLFLKKRNIVQHNVTPSWQRLPSRPSPLHPVSGCTRGIEDEDPGVHPADSARSQAGDR